MIRQLRDKFTGKYDLISLRKIRRRRGPGEGRIRTARQFTAWTDNGGSTRVQR
jgi:2-dehydro-3-deoxygluconokinase